MPKKLPIAKVIGPAHKITKTAHGFVQLATQNNLTSPQASELERLLQRLRELLDQINSPEGSTKIKFISPFTEFNLSYESTELNYFVNLPQSLLIEEKEKSKRGPMGKRAPKQG
jgi:hypothetical protein